MAWQKATAPDNSLALFKNNRRRGPDDPYYSGSGRISGRDYWVSGWVNESKKTGEKYISIKIRPKDGEARSPRKGSYQEPRAIDNDDMSDDIPF